MKYVILLLAFMVVRQSMACDCEQVSIREDYALSKIVVVGKVVAIYDTASEHASYSIYNTLDPAYPEKHGFWVKVEVIEDLKGTAPSKSFIIKPGWNNCDFYYKKDKKYVIFAHKDKNGHIRANKCSATFAYTDNQKLAVFNQIRQKHNDEE